jgi:hypothetical protein
MESEKQLRKRHERELSNLRKACNHKNISDWMNYYWAPGHILGKCKTCKFCGKIIEKTWQDPSEMKIIRKGDTFKFA